MTAFVDPFEEMKRFRKQMDALFEDFWVRERLISKSIGLREPSMDVRDVKHALEITVDLPGIDKKDIEVNLESDRIEIKAKKEQEAEAKGKHFYQHERSWSGFYRAFSLPALVDTTKAHSTFKNGVLQITLPKRGALPRKVKRLEIR